MGSRCVTISRPARCVVRRGLKRQQHGPGVWGHLRLGLLRPKTGVCRYDCNTSSQPKFPSSSSTVQLPRNSIFELSPSNRLCQGFSHILPITPYVQGPSTIHPTLQQSSPAPMSSAQPKSEQHPFEFDAQPDIQPIPAADQTDGKFLAQAIDRIVKSNLPNKVERLFNSNHHLPVFSHTLQQICH